MATVICLTLQILLNDIIVSPHLRKSITLLKPTKCVCRNITKSDGTCSLPVRKIFWCERKVTKITLVLRLLIINSVTTHMELGKSLCCTFKKIFLPYGLNCNVKPYCLLLFHNLFFGLRFQWLWKPDLLLFISLPWWFQYCYCVLL